jgi:hypothetical protein
MSKQTTLFTEDPIEALAIRGYQFSPAAYGFSLGPKNKALAYKVSAFGSVFMNDYMLRSGLQGAASFRYMFGAKRYEVGDLASCSPMAVEEIQRCGKSYDEADAKVMELFVSDELSKQGMKMPCLYEVPLVNAVDVAETTAQDGRTTLKIKGHDKPFYYLINLADPQVSEIVTNELPDDWKDMLTRCQYSYYFDVGGNRLAVSNTLSAYFGLPPNSKALRIPLLKTQIIPENCSPAAVGKKVTGKAKSSPKKAKTKSAEKRPTEAKLPIAEDPVAWQSVLQAFLDSPSEETHKALTDCASAWKQFYATKAKGDDALKLSKYAAKRMRKAYVGSANAMEGLAFVEMITSKWEQGYPRLMVILKWATLTRWEQGKVYFKEEPKQEMGAAGRVASKDEAEEPPMETEE